MQFQDMSLMPEITKALVHKGYSTPTPIQKEAIPIALEGKDLLATAQTGTGKTAAFAIPIIQQVVKAKQNSNSGIKALILSPTRELAIQIEDNIKEYAKYLDVSHEVIFGGVKQDSQVRAIKRGVDILVATPGRLLDLQSQGLIDLSQIKFFVLDEADRMLDMGFIHDIKRIINIIPKRRQTLFFSATLAGNILDLSKTMLYKPVSISVDPPASTAELINQYLLYTNKSLKRQALEYVIEKWKIDQAIVFTRTKHGADRLSKDLKKKGYKALALHGDKSQNNRQRTLDQFKDGTIQFLIATDIAARGIDIDKLGYVINYEIPNESEAYVHRIGRSGRAGEDGIAISISEPEENAYVKDIEKLMGQKIEVVNNHPFPQTDKPMTAEEKKQWNKEKQERKRSFFEARKSKKQSNPKKKNKTTNTESEASKAPNQQKQKQQEVAKNAPNPKTNNTSSKKKSKSKRSWKDTDWYNRTESKTLKDKYMWPLG